MERERKLKRAKEREKRGETRPLPQSPLVFSRFSLALVFARAPLSERLEQASGEEPLIHLLCRVEPKEI